MDIPCRDPIEPVEDLLLFILFDPDPRIGHFQDHSVLAVPGPYFDVRGAGRILQGIVEEVVDQVDQMDPISFDHGVLGIQCFFELPSLLFHLDPDIVERIFDDPVEVELFPLHLQLPSIEHRTP